MIDSLWRNPKVKQNKQPLKKTLFQKMGNDWYVFVEMLEEKIIEFRKLPRNLNPKTMQYELISKKEITDTEENSKSRFLKSKTKAQSEL